MRLRSHMAHVFRGTCEPVATATRPETLDTSYQSTSEEALAGILHLLHQLNGVDFREYKPATVVRRMERRTTVRQASDIHAYLGLLKQDRTETQTLGHEIRLF